MLNSRSVAEELLWAIVDERTSEKGAALSQKAPSFARRVGQVKSGGRVGDCEETGERQVAALPPAARAL